MPGARAFGKLWAEEFGGAVQAMSDALPGMEPLTSAPASLDNIYWWKQPLDAAPGACVWAAAPEETWAALGSLILYAAGIEEADAAEQKSTYLEVLKQSLGALARALAARTGREVTCQDGSAEDPPNPAGAIWFSVDLNGRSLPPLGVKFSDELLAAVEESHARDTAAPAPLSDESLSSEPDPDNEVSARAITALDLLLDVELPVSVSFGCTRLRMREVLKLISGSIIELDRSIAEPVDVIVNNCVIARGEVVVVEGNYGVRIHEVLSRRKRLQESRRSLLLASSYKK